MSARREESAERFSDLYLDHTSAGKREVSVLFADLAGFTAFSEARDPREVSEMLNAYFEVAIPPIVHEHGGEIDSLMATRSWPPGAPGAISLTTRIASAHPDWPRFRAAGQQRRGAGGRDGGGKRTAGG